jgi:hypothetical protein
MLTEDGVRLMLFDKARLANLISVIFSRGAGYAVLTSILLIKKWQISSAAFVTIGHDMVLAALILGPILSTIGQIQARRLVVSRDIKKNIKPIYFVSLAALVLFLMGALGSVSLTLWGFPIRTIIISCGFMLVHGMLGWLILWTALCHTKRIFLGICGIVFLGALVILAARLFLNLQFESENLLFEGLILLLADTVIVMILLIIPTQKTEAGSVYPFSWSNVSRYVIIVTYATGILALDWQLLKSILPSPDYQHIAEIRIYFERFLLPLLATLASASLLNAYRTGTSITGSGTGKTLISRNKVFLAQLCFGLVAIACAAVSPWNTAVWIVILGVGYVMFSINSFHLDLFQAQVSIWRLTVTLGLFLLAYGGIASVVIRQGGIAGHVVFWCVGNFVLFNVLKWRRSNAHVPAISGASGGLAP